MIQRGTPPDRTVPASTIRHTISHLLTQAAADHVVKTSRQLKHNARWPHVRARDEDSVVQNLTTSIYTGAWV